jgi:hypothetical protein
MSMIGSLKKANPLVDKGLASCRFLSFMQDFIHR